MIKLGGTYKDSITGFKGMATGYVKYLSGCNQALLTPAVNKGGEMPEPQWIDEQRLKQVGNKVITLDNGKIPGFGKMAPIK